MPDPYRRKRERNMRRVLREHGSPVPDSGCMMALVMLPLMVWSRLRHH